MRRLAAAVHPGPQALQLPRRRLELGKAARILCFSRRKPLLRGPELEATRMSTQQLRMQEEKCQNQRSSKQQLDLDGSRAAPCQLQASGAASVPAVRLDGALLLPAA